MKGNFLESDSLSAKRILIFGINRPQSEPTIEHVKRIADLYDNYRAEGIDDVYCVSFGDFILFDILMSKFSNKIKFYQIPDDLDSFKLVLGKKGKNDFLKDYWQFAAVLNSPIVEYYCEQPFKQKITADTRIKIYSDISPDRVLKDLGSRRLEA